MLIVNADDWGRDVNTTDKILDCDARGAISSVSAMVFMEDSDRSAEIAKDQGIDAGLHLNFTTPFTAPGAGRNLQERLDRVSRYLGRHRLAAAVFHPALARSFEYLASAQLEEYRRLYGHDPKRIDGHHHMHLCANVLLQRLMPAGTIVRRNFSFDTGEKSIWNRTYRKMVDRQLSRRHSLRDFFFSLPPLDPQRLARIYKLAETLVVEVETHPVQQDEYEYLAGGQIFNQLKNVKIARPQPATACVGGLS